MAQQLIQVVDDEKGMRELLERLLSRNKFRVQVASDAASALIMISEEMPDLIISDFKMPNMNGIEFLKKVKELDKDIPVVMMTAYGTMENAVEAMKQGAYDYINKPFDNEEILLVIGKALEKKELKDENIVLRQKLEGSYVFEDLVAQSNRMHKVFDLIRTVTDTKSHILIQGETGTGKELVARAIHNSGRQKERPFIPVDCAALTESLLESELFGHIKGAFTGATQDKKGLFEEANSGTLFLDEVGHISMEMQAKLLRVIQDKKIKRVGDVKSRNVDIRIIAAANEDLVKAVKKGSFREDLYYRLNVVLIEVPPLRQHKEDIPLLVNHFIEKYNLLERKKLETISEDAMNILMNYNWPGNIRELENLIHRAVVIKKTPIIQPRDLPSALQSSGSAEQRHSGARTNDFSEAKKMAIESFERRFLVDHLEECKGNVSRVARMVGIDRRNLQRKFKAYGIDPREYH